MTNDLQIGKDFKVFRITTNNCIVERHYDKLESYHHTFCFLFI